MSTLSMPFSLHGWVEKNRHLLRPPVGNKLVFKENDLLIMLVGGPNSRTDYHCNEGAEFFYQLEGDMLLKTMQAGRRVDIPIRQGEVFLLPPKIPHSPQRYAHSVGLVVERRRQEEEKDGLQWYCEGCSQLLYEEFFYLKNIERDFPPVFTRFYSRLEHRRCPRCQLVMPLPESASHA